MKTLKQSEIKKLRSELLNDQNGLCALCKQEIDTPCLDHSHKRNGGTGLVRGVICRGCNALLGKVENNARRNKIKMDLSDWLDYASGYLEMKHTEYLHPTEIPKKKKLKKSSYNNLKRIFFINRSGENSRNFPAYPTTGKLTVKLEKIYKKAGIKPEFYK